MNPAYRGRPKNRRPAPAGFHEIKHDGFRIVAYRNGDRVRVLTRNGYNFADRFPLIVDAIAALPVLSCIVDGEAVACNGNGLAVFELLRYRRRDQIVTLCAFDLIEREGKDLRTIPIEERKHTLANLLCGSHAGIAFNQHYEDDGAVIYKHACALGCEGIVSKRLGSPYKSGRSPYWITVKNPAAPAVTREAEEDWS